jgi:hypothetical protein
MPILSDPNDLLYLLLADVASAPHERYGSIKIPHGRQALLK